MYKKFEKFFKTYLNCRLYMVKCAYVVKNYQTFYRFFNKKHIAKFGLLYNKINLKLRCRV